MTDHPAGPPLRQVRAGSRVPAPDRGRETGGPGAEGSTDRGAEPAAGAGAGQVTGQVTRPGNGPTQEPSGVAGRGRREGSARTRGRRSPEDPSGLRPQTAVLLVSSFLAVFLVAVLFLLPVPYVVVAPGPAVNTLGNLAGRPVIEIEGRPTYPASGALDLTTVSLFGGPGRRVSVVQVLRGWLDGSQAVLPVETLFPPGQTQEESDALDQAAMTSSKESATAAALKVLGVPVPTTMTIAGFAEQAPSARVLEVGDVVLAVGGVRTPDLAALQAQLAEVDAGQEVAVRLRRDGAERTLEVPTTSAQGRTVLGVTIQPTFRFPITVRIDVADVAGPSAGMMFALGIYDKLTPGDLTGGQKIAGTGTLDVDGDVGRIGSIRQKLVGARSVGAQWFLAPAELCPEVVGHVPEGLRVVPVETLEEAVSSVESIAEGGTAAAGLPSC